MGSTHIDAPGAQSVRFASRKVAAPRKIRVAHLLHTVAYGGPETILINWIRAQNRDDFEVHLLCFADPNGTERPFVEAAKRAGLELHFLPWNRLKPVFRSARELSAYLRGNEIDILHCYNTYAELVGVIAKRSTGVKLITTKWMWGKLDWKRAILQRLERRMMRSFDRVTAQSEFAARLTAQNSIGAQNVDVLISGLDQPLHRYTASQRIAARAELGASTETFVLLHLARFYPEKAHDVLIRSFKIIVEQEPHAMLWLTGVGPLRESIEELVRELNLEQSVRFLGFRSDLDRLLPLVDAQIHSSNIEGIPLALCSGLLSGLPVVATAVGGVPEIVEDGVSGLLAPPNDPEALAQAAIRVIRDGALRQRLGARAQSFMQKNYSLQAAVHRLETLYREMLAA